MFSREIIEKTVCSVCSSSRIEEVINLPAFPLTGIFVEEDMTNEVPKGYDQELVVCADCGHVQLRWVLPPSEVYNINYTHRSSASHLAPMASSFLVRYIDSLVQDRTFECILEIGCNDLFLLNKMSPRSRQLVGIDPIWKDRASGVDPKVKVIGDFVEEVDLESQIGTKPDLIISTHNLEHINKPVEQLHRLMDAATEDALFVIEVPDIDLMIDNLRFDQVFHYHIHYFGLAVLLKLIKRIGGEYVGHTFNFRNWGGSLIIAFRKSRDKSVASTPVPRVISKELIAERHRIFRQRMDGFMRLVEGLQCDIWGYGAGQMVPAVAYNLRSDLSFLKGIFDDDPARNGLTYPHLPVRIFRPNESLDLKDAVVVITALDGVRAIISRLHRFNPRFILVPNDVF